MRFVFELVDLVDYPLQCGQIGTVQSVEILNRTKNVEEGGTCPFGFLTFSQIWGSSFLGLKFIPPPPVVLRPADSEDNHSIGFPVYPACRQQSRGLLSLYNCVSQFLNKSLSLSLHIYINIDIDIYRYLQVYMLFFTITLKHLFFLFCRKDGTKDREKAGKRAFP